MNDWAKYLIGIAAGYGAAILYKNYQAEQASLALAQRSPAQRLSQTMFQAGQDVGLIPASQVQGMGSYMPMPGQGFYGNSGMRQSAPGNPHAPVVIPRRQAPKAPPPPPPPPMESDGEVNEFVDYSDDNTMGGQRF